MQSPRLARIIKKCRDLPGYELFQYVDDEGNKHTIGSGDVNEYLKQISGGMDITSKDFRTWAGTVHALKAFHQIGKYENNTQAKKNIVQAIDNVAVLLGNTRTVCKKYYIHPAIIDAYQQGCLFNYLRALEKMEQGEKESGLTCEERLVVKVLKAMSESLPGLKKSA